jgi:hypothetical protein
LVVGGENILDFRTQFRFLEGESIEQNGGIRDAVFNSAKARLARVVALSTRGVLIRSWVADRELIKRLVWAEIHAV